MSETKTFYVPKDTVHKLKDISAKFGQLNTGAVGDNFWIATGEGGGGYDWEQTDIGVNKEGKLIICRQSGCSCNGPDEPTVDADYPLGNRAIELEGDGYDHAGKDGITELIKTTDTLFDVLNNENVSTKEIIALPNSEIRRAVIELVGYDKITNEAEILDSSETDGELMRIKLPEDEDLLLLHVKDPSTTREYFLRVPPVMKTSREARAWGFGFSAEDFNLEREA